MNYDKLLTDIFFDDDWHFNQSYLNKYKRHYKKKDKYQNIIEYINNRYIDSESFKETIYRIKHNINIRPVCKKCGNKVEFIGKSGRLFRDYCCNNCSANSQDVINKKQESDRKKNNGKLGWNHNSEEKKLHRKNTLINRYGSWENAIKEIERKRKEGVIKKYGVSNPMKDSNIKQKWKNSILNSKKIIGSSKQEQYIYNLLKQKYSDIVNHYTDKYRYPYICDFYIPSLDLFIEYQGHQSHGGHPYNKDDENDIVLANKIKEIFGNNLTFTKRDPEKREIAKKNNLNYIEFWNIKEVKQWIKNIK